MTTSNKSERITMTMLQTRYAPKIGGGPLSSSPIIMAKFVNKKPLCDEDAALVEMLNSEGYESVSYCISDPDLTDLPIIFASDAFLASTGYGRDEVVGRNCRFLQGADTSREDLNRIREAIKKLDELSVVLLNYKKDGSSFINEFFMTPMFDKYKTLAYFIGVQCSLPPSTMKEGHFDHW